MDNTILSNEKSIDKMEKVPLKEILSDNVLSHNTNLKSDKIDSMQSGEGYDSEDVDQENTCPNMLNNTLSFTLTQDNIEDETSTNCYKPRPSLLLNFDPLFFKNTPTRNCSLNLARIHENDNIDSLTNQFSNICINKVDNNVSSSECRLHQQKEYLKIINFDDTLDQIDKVKDDDSLSNISNNTQNLNETVDLSSGSDFLNTAKLNLGSNNSTNNEILELDDEGVEKLNTSSEFENANTKLCSKNLSETTLNALLSKYNCDTNITEDEITNIETIGNQHSTYSEHVSNSADFDRNSSTDKLENTKGLERDAINMLDNTFSKFEDCFVEDIVEEHSNAEVSKANMSTSPNTTGNQEISNRTFETSVSQINTEILLDENSVTKEISNEDDRSVREIDDVILERNKVILEEEKHRNKELTECIELKRLNESQESCSDLEIKLLKKNGSFENVQPKLEEEKESHNKELVEANELKQQLREFQDTCSNLEIQLRKKTESYEHLKLKLDEEVRRTKELAEGNKFEQQLRESQEACSNFEVQLRKKTESYEDLKQKLEAEVLCRNKELAECNEFKQQFRESQETCSNLEIQLRKKTESYDDLKQKLEEEVLCRNKEANEFKQRLRESEEMCSNLQKQLRDKSESNEELNKKLEEEKNCTQALQQSITNLQTQKNNELRESLEACSNLQLRLKEKDKGFQELQKKFDEEKNTTKRLETTIQDLQLQIASLNNDLSKCNLEIQNYRQIMEEFETQINKYYTALQKLKNEHTVVTQHLTNSELAFSDVHQKYERCKKIIEGYKSNENALVTSLAASENSIIASQQKYESLKTYAQDQITKCNKEIMSVHQQYENDINKLNTTIKRLEIKNSSLQELYDQKKKECIALTILCDEVTGKV
ncbi:hypothetical protein RN001_005447 [Aquatica leii]|uniref:Transforming acidic coiled-coil-containing protein C-terminal domain-containing protein n=1 Tax=Aquatica leii TaxID=1421715 RepID=A0AAN7PCQ5_9COLE|nr:hypothetical protein RN001_005447 [Aquatica leii]